MQYIKITNPQTIGTPSNSRPYLEKAFTNACMYNHVSLVEACIEQGVNIHCHNHLGIIWASEQGHCDIIKLLVKNGVDINVDNSHPLSAAIINGGTEAINLIIELGGELTEKGFKYAMEEHQEHVIDKMIDKLYNKHNFLKNVLSRGRPEHIDAVYEKYNYQTLFEVINANGFLMLDKHAAMMEGKLLKETVPDLDRNKLKTL